MILSFLMSCNHLACLIAAQRITNLSHLACLFADQRIKDLSHLASPLQSSRALFPAGDRTQGLALPREDSLENHARSRLIPHKSTVPLYPLHLQVRIQILRQCWQPSHLASPLQSSGSLFPIIWHLPCSPVDHYSQSPGITPAVQWITIPREDSLQIQARSPLIPQESAVPLHPLHLQVRIQILRHCWQPNHLASPLRSSGSLFPVTWHHPCGPVDHYSQVSEMITINGLKFL
eukprot:XP_017445633.1 PREDICTED: uncharacterized protein LOC102551177 isoform X1 [Rattus norvegicus]